jgi:hypothetical protein
MGVTPALALLTTLVALRAPVEPCPPAARVISRSSSSAAALVEELERHGIQARALGSLPQGCPIHDALLDGSAPPYALTVQGPDKPARRWRVHLIELAAVMVDATIRERPALVPDVAAAHRPSLVLLTARLEGSVDDDGVGAVGPGVSLAYCPGGACVEIRGHLASALQGPAIDTVRRVESVIGGALLKGGGPHWQLSGGVGMGFQHVLIERDPTLAQYALHVDEVAFLWEMGAALKVYVVDRFGIELSTAVQIAIPSEASALLRMPYDVGNVSLFVGLGASWEVEAP